MYNISQEVWKARNKNGCTDIFHKGKKNELRVIMVGRIVNDLGVEVYAIHPSLTFLFFHKEFEHMRAWIAIRGTYFPEVVGDFWGRLNDNISLPPAVGVGGLLGK